MKKFLAVLTTAALLSPLAQGLSAQGFPPPQVEGNYYPEYRVAPYVGPTVALLIIAAAVTVAVLLSSDSDHDHGHSGD